jgi:hypothetical protein
MKEIRDKPEKFGGNFARLWRRGWLDELHAQLERSLAR